MALVTPYCTVSEANTYLTGSTVWAAANTSQKDNALFWGRVYFDSHYSCIDLDEDDPDDEIKFANALLGEDYLDGTLLEDGSTIKGRLTKKRVKAGSVESEVEYLPGAIPTNIRDDVDQLLAGICSRAGAQRMIIRA